MFKASLNGQTVAVKAMFATVGGAVNSASVEKVPASVVKSVRREAMIMCSLNHPNILACSASSRSGGIVMGSAGRFARCPSPRRRRSSRPRDHREDSGRDRHRHRVPTPPGRVHRARRHEGWERVADQGPPVKICDWDVRGRTGARR